MFLRKQSSSHLAWEDFASIFALVQDAIILSWNTMQNGPVQLLFEFVCFKLVTMLIIRFLLFFVALCSIGQCDHPPKIAIPLRTFGMCSFLRLTFVHCPGHCTAIWLLLGNGRADICPFGLRKWNLENDASSYMLTYCFKAMPCHIRETWLWRESPWKH